MQNRIINLGRRFGLWRTYVYAREEERCGFMLVFVCVDVYPCGRGEFVHL